MLPDSLAFSPVQKRQVLAEFSGGAYLFRCRSAVAQGGESANRSHATVGYRHSGSLTGRESAARDRGYLRQRILVLSCDHEDLSDHDSPRSDVAFQTAVNRVTPLASKAALGPCASTCQWTLRPLNTWFRGGNCHDRLHCRRQAQHDLLPQRDADALRLRHPGKPDPHGRSGRQHPPCLPCRW